MADTKSLRILQVNKFHFLNGGAELYYLGLSDLLRAHGHTVHHFSMKHPENIPCDQAEYFIDHIDYENPGGLAGKMKIGLHTIYSREARRNIARLLDAEQYDLVHLHNYHHQITPSILPEIKKRGIPIVMTVQDFKIVCPNYKMLTHDGVCERCKGHKYVNCTIHRCNKGSLVGSLVNTVEMYTHHLMGYDNLYDLFVTPSWFAANKIVEFGLPKDKVTSVPNFIHVDRYEPNYEVGDYLLYLGRLSSEKGIETLIKAMERYPDVPLKITGRGPYEDRIRAIIDSGAMPNLSLTGHLSGDALLQTIQNCMAVVLPSEWYETFGLCLAEANACGKPVIGARIGGITEVIDDGTSGFLFESGSVDGLAEAIGKLVHNREQIPIMGRAGRERVQKLFGAEAQYDLIMNAYARVLN